MALTKYEIINTFPTLDKLVDSSFKINEAFFQNFLSKQTIYVARNREEYNREFGCPTQDWMVGYHCTPKSHILIMSPEGLEQTGFHERDSFSQILTHEINHRFMSDLYEFSFPIWVFEGLACYVANQFNESKLTDDIIDFPFDRMHYSDFYANSKYTYSKSGGFTNYLVNNASGSAYPAVNAKDFENADILVPHFDLITKFSNLAFNISTQQQILLNKNKNLKLQRDFLLPKLISGKINLDQ